jgi:hypothetical protein
MGLSAEGFWWVPCFLGPQGGAHASGLPNVANGIAEQSSYAARCGLGPLGGVLKFVRQRMPRAAASNMRLIFFSPWGPQKVPAPH